MGTSIVLRSVRSALKSTELATISLPTTGATTLTTLISQRLGSSARLFSSNVSDLELAKQREALEVIDDIVNSEAKLHALFMKWILYYDHLHFDLEDDKAFKERFCIFKDTARMIHQHNKSGSSFTCGLNRHSDLTIKEFATKSWKKYPNKAKQVTTGI
ncbi:hypothetical protein MKW92_016786 [Papaver armeniacum]|nr:hypothetical protein MKW92_016786 [Papaver armeniacum]